MTEGVHDLITYINVRTPRASGDVFRTIEVGPSAHMLVDLDADGHVLGIETFGDTEPDWFTLMADDRCRFDRSGS